MCTYLFYWVLSAVASAGPVDLDALQPFAKVSAPTCKEAKANADSWTFFHGPNETLASKKEENSSGG